MQEQSGRTSSAGLSRDVLLQQACHDRSHSHSPFSPTKLITRPISARNSGEFARVPLQASPSTTSRASSVSSLNCRDIDTAYSASSVNSPVSTCYGSEVSDFYGGYRYDSWRMRRGSRHHYRQQSTASTSTWAYDSDDETKDRLASLNKARYSRIDRHFLSKEKEWEYFHRVSPIAESVKSDRDSSPDNFSSNETEVVMETTESGQEWENTSAVSEDISPEDSESVLSYILQLVYGIDVPEDKAVLGKLQEVTNNFIHELSPHVWQSHGSSDGSSWQGDSSTQSSNTSPDSSRGSSKGKKHSRNGDDEHQSADERGSGTSRAKKAKKSGKEDENLRLSCPFRKRNPFRFNVRDHHSCAMTYFPKFAELRQHVVKQHKRDDPTAFVCDRCTQNFGSRKDLRDHQRLPKELMCDISEHDPESGIDSATATKLLSRKRTSGPSVDVQWKEVWNILFPDDVDESIHTHAFIPVVEHFELSSEFLSALSRLKTTLQTDVPDAVALDAVTNKVHQSFVESVHRCMSAAQTMRYINRSNKKTAVLKQQEVEDVAALSAIGRQDSVATLDQPMYGSPATMGQFAPNSGFSLMEGFLEWNGNMEDDKKIFSLDLPDASTQEDGSSAIIPLPDETEPGFGFWPV